MVSVEREEDSSSPNVKQILATSKRAGGERCIELSDGSSFFMPDELWLSSPLRVGDELSSARVSHLIFEGEVYWAKRKALELLSEVEHAAQGLRLKLIKRKFSRDVVDEVIGWLQQRGRLDDERFAASWIQFRLHRHPEGPAALLAGLSKKGISHEIASGAVDVAVSEGECARALDRAVEKLRKKSNMNDEKLLRALIARGFSYGEVRTLLEDESNAMD